MIHTSSNQSYHDLAALLPLQALTTDESNITVTGIQSDSRKVTQGDLFLAVPGIVTDGSHYIDQAVQKGASAVLINADGAGQNDLPVPCIKVENLAQKTGEIAGRFYGEPSQQLNVIAITGTNGKTSCGRIIAELAEKAGQKCMVVGTTGYGFLDQLNTASHTTPDAIVLQELLAWGCDQQAQMASLEVSSHALEQHRLSGVQVDTAIFTNLTRDHLDYHGSMESYGEAKRKLFALPGLNYAVINLDDKFGRELLADMPGAVQTYSYSLVSKQADLYAKIVENPKGICADIQTPWGNGRLTSSLLGDFNLSNLLASIAALCVSGVKLETVLSGIETLVPVEGRMESFGKATQPTVIVDFAHTPDALEKALNQLKQVCQGQLICVFGCGGDRDQGKRAMMGKTADQLCDHLILTDDNPRNEAPKDITDAIIAGMNGCATLEVIHDRGQAIERAISQANSKDYVLIAGKGHEQTQQYATLSIHFSDRKVVQNILGAGS
ncbi:MAG: UDP-N-acetylmuramoyl-L-alanyl-D-glutamate--2,6-diaminopimelate ligase [Pseudomonadales bacterium]|nr:UDP-N-acetylmuramoyl-L-alanyl-D-glutamate--2,6-diaminopimelate ligase [Pseudomonadales bacterium]